MTTLELILSTCTTLLVSSNVVQVFYIRATRKKLTAEASASTDAVLYKRIEYLEKRVSNLEKLACYDSDCKYRK